MTFQGKYTIFSNVRSWGILGKVNNVGRSNNFKQDPNTSLRDNLSNDITFDQCQYRGTLPASQFDISFRWHIIKLF
jgi:hypothetical protein